MIPLALIRVRVFGISLEKYYTLVDSNSACYGNCIAKHWRSPSQRTLKLKKATAQKRTVMKSICATDTQSGNLSRGEFARTASGFKSTLKFKRTATTHSKPR